MLQVRFQFFICYSTKLIFSIYNFISYNFFLLKLYLISKLFLIEVIFTKHDFNKKKLSIIRVYQNNFNNKVMYIKYKFL